LLLVGCFTQWSSSSPALKLRSAWWGTWGLQHGRQAGGSSKEQWQRVQLSKQMACLAACLYTMQHPVQYEPKGYIIVLEIPLHVPPGTQMMELHRRSGCRPAHLRAHLLKRETGLQPRCCSASSGSGQFISPASGL
jgi:hypothetical protein